MPKTNTPEPTARGVAYGLLAIAASFPALIPALLGQIPAHRDLLVFFLPMKLYLGQRLASGDLPLWDPFTEAGAPFMANLQSQVFYLPNVVTSLLPVAWAYGLFLAIHLVAAAWGMFAWARVYQLSRAAAAFAALAFALGGPFIASWEFSSIVASAAWIPSACWAAVRLAEAPRARYLVALVLAIGGLGLGGEPHTALAGAAMAFAFSIAAPVRPGEQRRPGRRAAVVALAGILGGALIAVQLVPFVELVSLSDRSGGMSLELSTMHSVGGGDLLGVLAPDPGAYDSASGAARGQAYLRLQYHGAVALLALAAALVTIPRRRRNRATAAAALAVLVVGWALAAGDALPLFPFLHRVGLLDTLRYPVKFIVPASAALALLAAFGLETLATGGRRAGGAAAALALATGILGAVTGDAGYWHAAAFALAAGTVVTLRLARPMMLTLVLGLDLLLAHALVHPSLPADQLLAEFGATRLVNEESGRIYPRPYTQVDLAQEARLLSEGDDFSVGRLRVLRMMGNLPMALQVRSLRGGPALRLANHARFLAVADRGLAGLPALRLGAVSHVLSMQPLASAALGPVETPGELPFLYPLIETLPRYRVVCQWTTSSDPVAEILRPDVAAGGVVVLTAADAARLPAAAIWTGTGSVQVLHDEPDDRLLSVRADDSCLLVVAENAYPGWQATVDDEAAPVLTVNGSWMAIPIDATSESVRLEFRPRSLRLGAAISFVALLCTLGWALRLRRQAAR